MQSQSVSKGKSIRSIRSHKVSNKLFSGFIESLKEMQTENVGRIEIERI